MTRSLVLAVFCGALCCASQSVFAGSWSDGRFLPAPWIEESVRPLAGSKFVDLGQGPYGLPLGGDLDQLVAWLEKSGVSVENPEGKDVGSDIRRVLLDHLMPSPEGAVKRDVASQQQELKRYSFAQIKGLLVRLQRKEKVTFWFRPFDPALLLERMNFLEISPSFSFHNKGYSFIDAIECGDVPAQRKDVRAVCGRMDLGAWQVVVRPNVGSLMGEQGVQKVYIRLLKDDDQRFKVYSCLLTAYAPSRVEIMSMIDLLSKKYGEYTFSDPDQLGRQESILKIRDGAESFPLCLVWGKNLVLFAVGSYTPSEHRVEIASERYQLLYADQALTDKFMAHLDAAIENAPFEEINIHEAERKRMEQSF